ncbi:MAG: hypothetical protein HC862_31975 [Scytonema sp. RU_4_4]|nr:hypothetical protein [Scytonema sp. RU_4_4]NJR72599.1 hypothetical protein [Scytonema sp. CRU_2_7]
MTQFLEKLQTAGVETKVKVTKEGVIQGISYLTNGVAFQAGKLGRNGKACTLKGLLSRGIDFDLERDVLALVQRATSNNQDDKQMSINTLIAKIQNHPQNLSMCTSDSHSQNVAQKSESANVYDLSNSQQQNCILKSQVNYLKHHKGAELDL